ncbi:MAG: helix-turn-helix domain-containing protein, partial [Oscillospiraceae bacterium]|nr:helix-turn-helix domain-containing protein [Oscillospiraceae bacterium]
YKKTPVEYITDLRIEHARSLIASNTPIETAALMSGFNDPKYFSRVVNKKFGHSPRKWKLYGK